MDFPETYPSTYDVNLEISHLALQLLYYLMKVSDAVPNEKAHMITLNTGSYLSYSVQKPLGHSMKSWFATAHVLVNLTPQKNKGWNSHDYENPHKNMGSSWIPGSIRHTALRLGSDKVRSKAPKRASRRCSWGTVIRIPFGKIGENIIEHWWKLGESPPPP